MTTATPAHHWTVTALGDDPERPHRAGHATTRTDAWTQALAAGRAALLAGELDTLAVTVDDNQPTAFYTPGRDQHGNLDPTQVTTSLVDLHQAGTAGELADQLAAEPAHDFSSEIERRSNGARFGRRGSAAVR